MTFATSLIRPAMLCASIAAPSTVPTLLSCDHVSTSCNQLHKPRSQHSIALEESPSKHKTGTPQAVNKNLQKCTTKLKQFERLLGSETPCDYPRLETGSPHQKGLVMRLAVVSRCIRSQLPDLVLSNEQRATNGVAS